MKKIIYVLCIVLLLVGCSSNIEPLTAKEFKTFMEDKGLTVTNEIDSANGDSSYDSIYVASDLSKYSFEYYFMKDIESASDLYTMAMNNLDSTYKDDSSARITSKRINNIGKYEVSASDYYCVVWLNENTVMYITGYIENKEEIKDILNELGY